MVSTARDSTWKTGKQYFDLFTSFFFSIFQNKFKRYACGTDMWSLGCIFYEMLTNQPLFAGDSEIDQLFKIFHILGTPNTTIWPELKDLPDWNEKFPHFNGTVFLK